MHSVRPGLVLGQEAMTLSQPSWPAGVPWLGVSPGPAAEPVTGRVSIRPAMRISAVSGSVTAIRCTTPLCGPAIPDAKTTRAAALTKRENLNRAAHRRPIRITAPASRQHQRRREHRPVRDPADYIVRLVVPRFTGETRAGQQHVITPEQPGGNARRARFQDQPRAG